MRIFTLCAISFLVMTVSGCISLNQPSPDIVYYTLEYETPAVRVDQLPVVLRLDRFTASPHCNTDRIVYRDKANERDTYVYHHWRARPADMVTYFLGRDLQAGNRFVAVLTPGSSSASTHTLEGRVSEFMEWDNDSNWEALLSVTVTLLKEAEPDVSKRVVWQKQFTARQASDDKHPRSVAQAMSRAMADISGQVEKELYGALSHP